MQTNLDAPIDKPKSSTSSRVARYITKRAIILYLMVAIGLFLAIVVINYGGYIDNIHRADISEALNFISLSMPGATNEELLQATEQARWAMEEAYGLHQPFLLRCVRWWFQTMTFQWGTSYKMGTGGFMTGNQVPVLQIVLDRVPYTLLLAGATNFILFFASIFIALNLSKKQGGFVDRMIITLSPLSSIPNWVYGIILTVIFAGTLHILPFNGLYDTFPPATKLGYIPIVAKHMILPVTAICLGMFFSAVYTWRTFFLIHAGEDYLEMAQAKGVPTRMINRRYILKPALPFIITSFAILMITFWQSIIVLEVFFEWPGLGELFMTAMTRNNMRITVGIIAVFAYLLALSVFLLDIIYALVDPRIRMDNNGQTLRPVTQQKNNPFSLNALNQLWRSYFIRRNVTSTRRKLNNLPGKQFLASPYHGRRTVYASSPITSSQGSSRNSTGSGGYCPYLKRDNNRGQPIHADCERCRCYVHGHPQRVGRAFQTEVCRTASFRSCPRLLSAPSAQPVPVVRAVSQKTDKVARSRTSGFYTTLREFLRYPAAVLGVAIILSLIGVSIYTMITIPYKEAIQRWAPETEEKLEIPKTAQPEWVNLFLKDKLPPTIIQDSANGTTKHGSVEKVFIQGDNGIGDETITYTIDYPYGDYPFDMAITFDGEYKKKPFVSLTWTTPDGREFKLGNFSIVSTQRYLVSQDMPRKYLTGQSTQRSEFLSGVGGSPAVEILFAQDSNEEKSKPLKGTYTLRIDGTVFEPGSSLDAKLTLYGKVYGLAGTDDNRRDLSVALLWGTPVALAFGFLGAISTCLLSMMIAAVGVWFDGWLDNLIQRLTEINMILPVLPIAISIYYLYSKSVWVVLGVLIILSIFGSAIKTYRAAFLQAKELPYIEAAKAYGASNWRIIRLYLVPRIIPLLIPQLVILVPSYVFFEATLAYLHVSDPVLPTWGKVVYDALSRGAYEGHYYWVLEPVALMILTGLAFAVVGFALDSILNPRLRRM